MNPQMNPYLQAYMQALMQQFPNAQQQANPQMSMPTIHADIIQVRGQDVVDRYSVGVGQSQMFILQDESAVFVKTGTENGPELVIYDKRPPAPPAPVFDPQTYVTREELVQLLNAMQGQNREEQT